VAEPRASSRLVVVAPLKDGMRERAAELIEDGPPFEPEGNALAGHEVYVTDREVVFVFEAEQPRAALEELAGDPSVWRAARAWREILAGRPRLAQQAYGWSRSEGGQTA
jgi:hypothetical protein